MRKGPFLLLVVLVSIISVSGCTSLDATVTDVRAVLVEGTGSYSRPISTQSERAQKFFDQGLRLTWGFFFVEAVASHQEALRHDPDHPMIYWGLALALGPNPNSRYFGFPDDPQGEARKAINRARELIGNANDKERALVEALYIRFDTDRYETMAARDQAYLEAIRTLQQRYPDDPDVATLLADAFMITTPWHYWEKDGRPKTGTEDVVQALENVMELHPDHPGANHFFIHVVEASPNPERALVQADRLESLMPIAGHIVHMPSHIYVRVGQYDKAIASNVRSAAADEKFLKIWGDHPYPQIGTFNRSAKLHRKHSQDFIRYSAAAQGNYARAIAAARATLKWELEVAILRGPGQRTVAAVWLIHKMFGQWDALQQEERVREGFPYLDGIWLYVQGSAHVSRGEITQAQEALSTLQILQSDPALEQINVAVNSVSTLLKIAALGLEGEIKEAEGDFEGAIVAYKAAVDIEDDLSYLEPPDWAQPMRHYLGAALLQAGRATEAERVYRRDMQWNQNNGWALFGLWKSLEAQGRTEEARAINERFEESWKDADVALSASRF